MHAGAGGLGQLVIQMAKHLGAKVQLSDDLRHLSVFLNYLFIFPFFLSFSAFKLIINEQVITTVSSEEKAAIVRKLGADHVIVSSALFDLI